MKDNILEELKDVYEVGYNEGFSGQFDPEDNPYDFEEQKDSRYVWGEGFFDGYKDLMNSLKEEKIKR